ncbi:response regulator [Massilia niastensis]|uniref:response regulator n=1 Tax=Massilia niastensis TaxID=544911 RepID=UPI0003A49D74|nr:response regulator [Massilia niastensis]
MTPAPTALPSSSQRVLVLDDDRFVLEVLEEMLAGIGDYHVATELDARSALARLDEHAPDILICDLMLPEMDGIEFLQAAAGQGFSGRVILLSALDDSLREAAGELARALGLRVSGGFRKPIGTEQLRRALEC